MPEYLSPGVYVEEVPSTIKPIAGVSTSTAAFLGVVPNSMKIPEDNPGFDPTKDQGPNNLSYRLWTFPFPDEEYDNAKKRFDDVAEPGVRPPRPKAKTPEGFRDFREAQDALALAAARRDASDLAPEGQPILCTTFAEFTRHFGGFSTNGLLPEAPAGGAAAAPDANGATPAPGQNQLAHGIFGFFNNGGTRCYVMRYARLDDLRDPQKLAPFEAIDEISLVAAPGIMDPGVQSNIVTHCTNMSDRFAILDAPERPADLTLANVKVAHNTDYGAVYFPWIKVFDAATQAIHPDGDGEIFVGPSGHVAGIYSRVDHERGVHKAPANEVVRGALDIEYQISRNLQDGFNPEGVNCIRNINDNITVWGARTIGGDFNTDLKYINVRRTLLFLRKSIDHGTQWVVFEPNDRTLWAKIVRNITAFLTMVWRDGALFGSTPQEAFYVRCDDETNPPEARDLGRVTTEIGVAIVRPAEFVIFRISQWAGPQAQ
jgi:Bacteriophage tail sheath protein